MSQKAETVTKEIQKFDRTEIEFKEKEKHIQSKKKKLSKALQTVRQILSHIAMRA